MGAGNAMSSWPLVVVDASALASLVRQDDRAAGVRQAIGEAEMAAPDLVRLEVLSVLRGDEARGDMSARRAMAAVTDLSEAPLRIFGTGWLVEDVWSLRRNLTTYDAAYVALARQLGCPLVTADERLANSPGSKGVSVLLVR